MIKININKKDNLIDNISIKGHALYDESGKDIVCSSVSSIVITTVNAIIRFQKEAIKYDEKDGYLKIEILNHSDIVDLLIDNMIDLLYELEDQYKKYIKINK
jgi:uncharacterized protein